MNHLRIATELSLLLPLPLHATEAVRESMDYGCSTLLARCATAPGAQMAAAFRRPSSVSRSPPRFPPIVSSFLPSLDRPMIANRTDGRNAEWLFEASRFWQERSPSLSTSLHHCR